MTSRPDLVGQRAKPGAWIRQVVNDAHSDGIVERAAERQLVDVGLNDVCVSEFTCRRVSDIYCRVQVDADDVTCTLMGGQPRVPALAAGAVEYHLAREEIRRHARYP